MNTCEHCGHDWSRHNQATGYLEGDSRRCDCGCYWTDPTPRPEPAPPTERDLLISRIEGAIWAELRRQAEEDTFGPCVMESDGIVDGCVNMSAVAAAVLAAFEAEQS